MKILIIAPFPQQGNPIKGGVEAVVHNLTYGFRDFPDVKIIILSLSSIKEEVVNFAPNIIVHFIKRHYGSNKIEFAFHYRKEILLFNKNWQPDIIHVQGNGSNFLLYHPSIANKLVFTQHGVILGEFKASKNFRERINYLISFFIEKVFRKKIHYWVFISRYNLLLNDNLLKKGILYKQIYNPVNPEYFYNKLSSKRNCYFIGRIVPLKGLHVLIEAIGKVRNLGITLDIIGDFTEDSYRLQIEDKIAISKCEDNVYFHGWKNGKEIRDIVTNDLILVLPSFQETLPVVIAEAMAMGKIVVATNIGGIPEMVTNETGFLFAPNDSEGLASILKHIQTMPKQEIEEMSLKAIQRAKLLYNPKNVAKEHINFYHQIVRSQEY